MDVSKTNRFSFVPQLDRSPRIIKLAATPHGKALCVAVFALLLVPFKSTTAFFIGIALAAFTAFPGRRFVILLLATTMAVLLDLTDLQWDAIEAIEKKLQIWKGPISPIRGFFLLAAVIAFCALLHALAKRKRGIRLPYPVATSIGCYILLASFAYYLDVPAPVKSNLWALLLLYGIFIWYVAYSLRESRSRDQNPFWLQLGLYLPFWNPTSLPIPKGSANLKRIATRTEEEAAICRLKGIKLLIWVIYLDLFRLVLNGVVHGNGVAFAGFVALRWDAGYIRLFLDNEPVMTLWKIELSQLVPVYGFALSRVAKGESLGVFSNWLAMLMFFANDLLSLAISPNLGVATARMCGFMALRSTHNPLKARTVVDFWNRYNYYYKELLLTIFYYPAYFLFFKGHQKARIFIATICSVIIGNFFFHYVFHFDYIYSDGPLYAINHFKSFGIYAAILAIALYFSQLRTIKRDHYLKNTWLNTTFILSFYGFLAIFADLRYTNVGDNIRFLLSLFGI